MTESYCQQQQQQQQQQQKKKKRITPMGISLNFIVIFVCLEQWMHKGQITYRRR